MRPIIDAHLDLAWNALYFERDLSLQLDALRTSEAHMQDVRWRGRATISLPELRAARVAVCVATVLARAGTKRQATYRRIDLDYASPEAAYSHAQGQLAYYRLLESQGELRILRTRADLDSHWVDWNSRPDTAPLGVILSMEGCDPIPTADHARRWFGDGLRAAGLTHYGVGRYAYGTGTDGPLAEEGRALLDAFAALGIAVDVTHLSDESMADVLDTYEGPVLASHHNCRALVPGDRQLTDEQLRRLIERDAVIGSAMDAWMLYKGWERGVTSNEVVSLAAVADHMDHICQLAGNARHVAIGSDLDGGFGNEQTPRDLRRYRDVHRLVDHLANKGFTDKDIDGVFFGNWLGFFRAVLPGSVPD